MSHPRFIYGTAWKEDQTADLVRSALDAGFRAFDTANQRRHYHEEGVGQGLASFRGARDELWLQTKFTFRSGQDHRLPYDPTASVTAQVRQSFASSKRHLGVEWVDSLVLHGPATREGLTEDDRQAWSAMQGLFEAGEVRALGVSNVTADQLRGFAELGAVGFVQNRCYATREWDAAVRAVCEERSIRYQGFSLLTANRQVWGSPVVAEIARAHQLTPAQVLFVVARSLGILPLTGTSSQQHMAEALDSQSATLPDDRIETVLALR